VCMVVSFVATHIKPVRREEDVEAALKLQLFLTALGVTGALQAGGRGGG
jgi:hypothetical protein